MVIEVGPWSMDRLSQELTYPRWPVASKINPSAQIHVRFRSFADIARFDSRCPLYPRKQTFDDVRGVSGEPIVDIH
jgi:hypothetical protein